MARYNFVVTVRVTIDPPSISGSESAYCSLVPPDDPDGRAVDIARSGIAGAFEAAWGRTLLRAPDGPIHADITAWAKVRSEVARCRRVATAPAESPAESPATPDAEPPTTPKPAAAQGGEQ